MIDYFALALTHALIVIALLRILRRDELDNEDPLDQGEEAVATPNKRDARRTRRTAKDTRDA